MKITIVTIGSRGDIQPFLALAVGLTQAGHQVKLATHNTFASWIKSYGLDFAPLEGNPQEWLESEAGKKLMESAKNPLQYPEQLTEIALQALATTKQRGILLTGWGGISNADLPDEVLKIDSVPHYWLFPQCAAVVHHGGAGTTAAGLRAGVPTIIIPFLGDQPFWGNRLASLGVGTEPILQQELTANKLSQAIATVIENKEIASRAKDLGKQIKSEDGVGHAVKIIESSR